MPANAGTLLLPSAPMSAQIISFKDPVEAEASAPAADRLLQGNPSQSVANYFSDPSHQFFSGRWSSTQGLWRIRYTENELCVITHGKVILTSDSGERSSFGPGDAFVIPAGFSGTWEVVEDCTKIYAIFEQRT